MSSPFNPLSALTPAGAGLTPLQTGASALGPSLLGASAGLGSGAGLASGLDGISPHPFLQPSPAATGSPAVGGTPWLLLAGLSAGPGSGAVASTSGANPLALGLGGLPQLNTTGLQGPGPGADPATQPGGPSAQAATDADDTLRAIPDICRILERAEALAAESAALERGIFASGEGAERAGALCRLESLQLDYAQTLFALISLASTYLVGALPVNLAATSSTAATATAATAAGASAAAVAAAATTGSTAGNSSSTTGASNPTVAGTSAVPASSTPSIGATAPGAVPAPPSNALPTTADLAAWTEARAQTMFARREAVRNASKAVSDVLKGGR